MCEISTEEILQDIKDTEQEIKDLKDEQEILMRDPAKNKVRLFMILGNINQRKDFIFKLNNILKEKEVGNGE